MHHQRFLLACFGWQVIGVAVFFALLLKPVAVEETEEIEQVLLGKRKTLCSPSVIRSGWAVQA